VKWCARHNLSDALLEFTGGTDVSIGRIGDLLRYDLEALLAVVRTR
jgi:hypothetical protein